MIGQLIWGSCVALELLLLLRAAQTTLFTKFPTFYFYIGCILLTDLSSIAIYKEVPQFYGSFYWATNLLLAIVGYGVIVEIFRLSLKNYPGVARMVQIVLLIIFFAVAAKVILDLIVISDASYILAIAELERYLRLTQATLLACLIVLFLYYKIRLGRNLRGLVLGYSFFIGFDIIAFTFISDPASGFAALLREIGPVFNAISLAIWLISLWSFAPEPAGEIPAGMGQEYTVLVRETGGMLRRARADLARMARL